MSCHGNQPMSSKIIKMQNSKKLRIDNARMYFLREKFETIFQKIRNKL